MRSRPFILAFAACAATLTVASAAGPRRAATYTPPPVAGEVYTVIAYRGDFAHPLPTHVAVEWGGWKHDDTVAPAAAGENRGFVLKLKHTSSAVVSLTITTDGDITASPMQEAPPHEWIAPSFQQVQW